jgi:dTDP-4-amino-4,6-dideoxygalactose transaminase
VIPLNDLSRRFKNPAELTDLISSVIEQGRWVHGEHHGLFELELAEFLKVNYVVGVGSGTDALTLGLRAVGCGDGSKIITVANAGGYASIAGSLLGCEILYCDVDSETLLMDPRKLEEMLTGDIKAVVVTHLYGNVAPVSKIVQMCKALKIRVVEDCAQALGATEFSSFVGSIGDIATFSFYPTKNLGGIGDGGAVVTNDSRLAEDVRALRQYGWRREKYKIELSGGWNSRLDEIQAAILRKELTTLQSKNLRRIEIILRYQEALADSKIKMVTSPRLGGVCHLAVLQLTDQFHRDNFREFMKKQGVETSIHYPVLDTDQPGLNLGNTKFDIPVSVIANSRIVSIPLFPELEEFEINTICDSLRQFSLLEPERKSEN